MNRIHSHLEEVNLIAKLADLKEQHYRNSLALSAILDLLVEKGVFTTHEFKQHIAELDAITPDPSHPIS